MDIITHRTGITPAGKHINSRSMPTQPERHANRHARACATMALPPGQLAVRELVTADGRHAYPDVVQYQVKRWSAETGQYEPAELVDLPPTFESHPDDHAADLARETHQQPRPCTLPYQVVVHDLAAYEHLSAIGALYVGHAMPGGEVEAAVDHRSAPGA